MGIQTQARRTPMTDDPPALSEGNDKTIRCEYCGTDTQVEEMKRLGRVVRICRSSITGTDCRAQLGDQMLDYGEAPLTVSDDRKWPRTAYNIATSAEKKLAESLRVKFERKKEKIPACVIFGEDCCIILNLPFSEWCGNNINKYGYRVPGEVCTRLSGHDGWHVGCEFPKTGCHPYKHKHFLHAWPEGYRPKYPVVTKTKFGAITVRMR
jgi:hypothetical protein